MIKKEVVSKEFVDQAIAFLEKYHNLIIARSGGMKGVMDISYGHQK